MPTYRYKCDACNKEYEVEQKITEAPLTECPMCKQGACKRIPAKEVSFQFKGTGFYKTDYKDDKPGGGCGKSSCGCK